MALRVQSVSNTSVLTSVAGTLSTTPIQGNMILAAVTADVGAGVTAISGYTSIGNVPLGLAGGLELFYKVATAAESGTITATATLATFMDLHVYEYSGLDNSAPLLTFGTVADSGSGVTSRSSGTSAIAANAPALTFVATAQALTNGAGAAWTNGMNTGITTTHLITGDLPIFTSVAQNSTASWNTSQRSAGMIALFLPQQGNRYYGGGR